MFQFTRSLLRSVFDLHRQGQWNYSKSAHEWALDAYDTWLGNLCEKVRDDWRDSLKTPAGGFEVKKLRSSIEMTNANWYGRPELAEIKFVQDAALWFRIGPVVSTIRKNSGGKIADIALKQWDNADRNLSMRYERLQNMPGYKRLQDVCAEKGMICILTEYSQYEMSSSDPTKYFGVKFCLDIDHPLNKAIKERYFGETIYQPEVMPIPQLTGPKNTRY